MKPRFKSEFKEVARNRINELFSQAERNDKYAKRYVGLARRLATRYKVKIPLVWRRRMCKACNAFWVAGRNCVVRTRSSRIIYHCECGAIARYVYKRSVKK